MKCKFTVIFFLLGFLMALYYSRCKIRPELQSTKFQISLYLIRHGKTNRNELNKLEKLITYEESQHNLSEKGIQNTKKQQPLYEDISKSSPYNIFIHTSLNRTKQTTLIMTEKIDPNILYIGETHKYIEHVHTTDDLDNMKGYNIPIGPNNKEIINNLKNQIRDSSLLERKKINKASIENLSRIVKNILEQNKLTDVLKYLNNYVLTKKIDFDIPLSEVSKVNIFLVGHGHLIKQLLDIDKVENNDCFEIRSLIDYEHIN